MRRLFKYRRLLSLLALGLFTTWRALQHPPAYWQQAQALVLRLQDDWAEEKRRLLRLLGFGLLASCFALAALLLTGFVALLLSWHTAYFGLTCLLLIGGYSLAALRCVLQVLFLARQSQQAFAASKEALAVSLANLRSA